MSRPRIVWDTAVGRVVPPEPPRGARPPEGDGVVRMRRETAGRGGKTVTTLAGFRLDDGALADLAKAIKRHCGVGGALRDGVLELQGDQRDRVEAFLRARGIEVLRAGG